MTKDKLDPPELTEKELKEFRRVTPQEHARFHQAYINTFGKEPPVRGRPPLGEKKARSIQLRVPPAVLARLRAKASKLGIGYQTLINQVLARV